MIHGSLEEGEGGAMDPCGSVIRGLPTPPPHVSWVLSLFSRKPKPVAAYSFTWIVAPLPCPREESPYLLQCE